MANVRLGRTEITVPKNGFGALPIQRISLEDAVALLRRAYDGGIRFFDTARSYSDSEEKLGAAFEGMREKLYIATKTPAQTGEDFWKDLETSLKLLRTDYVDLYQFHNPDFCPKPGDGTGLYEAMLECREKDMGFIAMKALAGGTINNSSAAYAYMLQFDNVLPIWGIQRGWELKEFLNYEKQPPALDDGLRAVIEKDRRELAGNFCRGCGYCMPCPQGIEINQCARMSLMLRRAPTQAWLTQEWQEKMEQITSCVHCNQCASKCPYGLDTPALLLENLKDYREVLAGKPL